MTEILSISHLTVTPKNVPKRYLVKDVSFQLSAGKTTCIVGESGSGKSLTALSVMGLLSSQLQASGSILFQKQELTTLDNKAITLNAVKLLPLPDSPTMQVVLPADN